MMNDREFRVTTVEGLNGALTSVSGTFLMIATYNKGLGAYTVLGIIFLLFSPFWFYGGVTGHGRDF